MEGLAVFMAKYPGKCGGCGERFETGRMVGYLEDTLVTEDCHGRAEVAAMSPGEVAVARKSMCSKCFCVHAGECV